MLVSGGAAIVTVLGFQLGKKKGINKKKWRILYYHSSVCVHALQAGFSLDAGFRRITSSGYLPH